MSAASAGMASPCPLADTDLTLAVDGYASVGALGSKALRRVR